MFIFPDLDSGNIAYKVTQHIGGYFALGPLLQGLNKPFHDLSRGCSIDDVVSVSMIAALQSNWFLSIQFLKKFVNYSLVFSHFNK